MNCIEALREQIKECEPCRMNSYIVTFWELPEHEKFNFHYYEEDKHYLFYCTHCDHYKMIGET
jgi:hypothetical protein